MHGHSGDLGEGFLGEEGLMGGDENIGKAEQAGKFIVLQHLAGEIFEKDAFLLFIHIQRDSAEVAGFECLNQSGGVHQATATGIDEIGARFGEGDGLGIEQVVRLWGERQVEGNDVAGLKQLIQWNVANVVTSGPVGLGHRIIGQDLAAKAFENGSGAAADFSGADETDGLAMEIKADEAAEREVQLAHAIVSAVDLAVQCQQQCHGVLGDRVWRVGGHTGDGDAEFTSCGEIDVVEPGATQRYELNAEVHQFFQAGTVEMIVDENANG